MKKAFAALSLAVLSLVGATAFAAGVNGAVSVNGMTSIDPSRLFSVEMRVPDSDLSLKTIVNTFNTGGGDAYDCCNGWTISSADSIVGARQDVAMPFTPDANYFVKQVTVAVGYVTGTNGVYVSLNEDAGGAPGAMIRKGNPTGLPVFGGCCATATFWAKGAPVTAGTQYWVVVKTTKRQPDTWDAWNVNNIGASGPFAFKTGNGTGWQATSGTLSAFSVQGK